MWLMRLGTRLSPRGGPGVVAMPGEGRGGVWERVTVRNGRALALQPWEPVVEKAEEERLPWKQNAERQAAEGGSLHKCAHGAASSSAVTPELGRLVQ